MLLLLFLQLIHFFRFCQWNFSNVINQLDVLWHVYLFFSISLFLSHSFSSRVTQMVCLSTGQIFIYLHKFNIIRKHLSFLIFSSFFLWLNVRAGIYVSDWVVARVCVCVLFFESLISHSSVLLLMCVYIVYCNLFWVFFSMAGVYMPRLTAHDTIYRDIEK